MPKSAKPRKAHRPRLVNKNACLVAIERNKVVKQPVDETYAAEFEMAGLTALDAVTRGYGDKSSWDTLANCLNHGWLMSKAGIGFEARPSFHLAHEAMRRMIHGFEATGRIEFLSAADQKTVEEALLLWSVQIRMATIGQIHDATQVVERHYYRAPDRRAA